MKQQQANNPLHGITLEQILNSLVKRYGWERLGKRIEIRCFNSDPSIKSSLKFLRKTPWARTKVENLYLATERNKQRRAAREQARRDAAAAAKSSAPESLSD